MLKKYIFFSFILTVVSSQASSGNLFESWGELEALKVRARLPSVTDAEFLADFQAYKAKNPQHTADALRNFQQANKPCVAFEHRYGLLISHARNGRVPDVTSKTCLMDAQACLQDRRDQKERKWGFFRGIQPLLDNTPNNRAFIIGTLDQVSSLLTPLEEDSVHKYIFDATTGQISKRQKRDVSSQASNVDSLETIRRWFAEKMGVDIIDSSQMDESMRQILATQTAQWRERLGMNTSDGSAE